MSYHSRHHRSTGRSSGRRSAPLPVPEEPNEDGARTVVIAVLVGAALILGGLGAWLFLGSEPVVMSPPPAVQPTAGGSAGPVDPAPAATRRNEPPTAVIRLQAEPGFPFRYQYSGIFSEDRDPEDLDRLTYHWDFGDGTTDVGGVGEHRFAAGGEVTVTLTVTDTLGATGTAMRTVTLPPIRSLEPDLDPSVVDDPGLLCYRAQGRHERFAAWDRLWAKAEPVVWPDVNAPEALRPSGDWFGLSFRGGLVVEQGGIWALHLTSDDGSRLELAGEELIRMERRQGSTREMVLVELSPGTYSLRIDYWQGDGGRDLEFAWSPPGVMERSEVPASALVHAAKD